MVGWIGPLSVYVSVAVKHGCEAMMAGVFFHSAKEAKSGINLSSVKHRKIAKFLVAMN